MVQLYTHCAVKCQIAFQIAGSHASAVALFLLPLLQYHCFSGLKFPGSDHLLLGTCEEDFIFLVLYKKYS